MSRALGTPHKHQSELIDEFDLLLGRSIRYFQKLEQMLEIRFLQLAAKSSRPKSQDAELLQIAVAELPFSTKLRLLATLLAHQLPIRSEYKACHETTGTKAALAREMKRAIASLKLFGKLEESRNRIVHSHWFVMGQPPESRELVPVIRHKTRATPKRSTQEFEEFSAETFRAFLSEAETVEKEFSQATGRLLGLLDYDEDKKVRSRGKVA